MMNVSPASLEVFLTASDGDRARLAEIVVEHHAFAWRIVRRLGLPSADVDDAVSHVFDVVGRRLAIVEAGKERAFIVQVCVRTASESRRADATRRRLVSEASGVIIDAWAPSPEDLLEEKEARALLDVALDSLGPEMRAVFTLHELEQMTMAEIAESLGIAPGTVASRLRRARRIFEETARRIRADLTKADEDPVPRSNHRTRTFASLLVASATRDAPGEGALERELKRLGLEDAHVPMRRSSHRDGDGSFGAIPVVVVALAGLVAATLALRAVSVTEVRRSKPSTTAVERAMPRPAPFPGETSLAKNASLAPSGETSGDQPTGIPVIDVARLPRAASAVVVPAASLSSLGAHVDELTILERARAALHTSPSGALAAVDEHDVLFPASSYREEAALIRIEALLTLGRRAEAERIALPILREREGAPIASRVATLLGTRGRLER